MEEGRGGGVPVGWNFLCRVFLRSGICAEGMAVISKERLDVLISDVPKFFRAVWRRFFDYPVFWAWRGWLPGDFCPRYWRGIKLNSWRDNFRSGVL